MEEVTHVGALLACCAAGAPCRSLAGGARRGCGAALGLLVVWLVCGLRAPHALLLAAGNVLIMRCVNWRHMHVFCLVYSWIYLLYLHVTVSSNHAIGIYQTLALRLVGLASEINSSHQLREQTAGGILQPTTKFALDDEMSEEPGVVDMFQYAFSYIGIQKGPYYRWKTFDDCFTRPYSTLGDCRVITEMKLRKAAICSALCMWLKFKYPLSEYEKTEFYWRKGPDYRFLYGAPQLARHVLACQLGALLATAACCEAGLALYPASSAAPDNAPLAAPDAERRWSRERVSYSFSAIKSFDYSTLVAGPSMRKTLRSWDMCLQYWFWAHIYRKIEHPCRHVRNAISFAVWCVWCGPSMNQLILGTTLWMYIYLEDVYSAKCRSYTTPSDSERIVWMIGFSLARALCLVYVAPCLVLRRGLIGYYSSVYWALHAALAAAALVAAAADYLAHRRSRSSCPQPPPPPARRPSSQQVRLPTPPRPVSETAPAAGPEPPPVLRVLPEHVADAPPLDPNPRHRDTRPQQN